MVITPYFISRQPSTGNGTFGILTDETGNVLCHTCERPWLNNIPKISCVPIGTYNVIPHNSLEHPNTWEIVDVPGRSGILIHSGNVNIQSEGCVLVGDSLGIVDGYPAVLNSVETLEKLRTIFPKNFVLIIKNVV